MNNFGNVDLELVKEKSATDRGPEKSSGTPVAEIPTKDQQLNHNQGSSLININIENIQLKKDLPTPQGSGQKVQERTNSRQEADSKEAKIDPAKAAQIDLSKTRLHQKKKSQSPVRRMASESREHVLPRYMQPLRRKQSTVVSEEAGTAITPYAKPAKNAGELPRIGGLSPIRTRNQGRQAATVAQESSA